MMTCLVSYDINTETREGRRRLAQAARICLNFGQRAQKSVFECMVDQAGYERLAHELRSVIDPESDSVRIYRLPADRESAVTVFGLDTYVDYEDSLIL